MGVFSPEADCHITRPPRLLILNLFHLLVKKEEAAGREEVSTHRSGCMTREIDPPNSHSFRKHMEVGGSTLQMNVRL